MGHTAHGAEPEKSGGASEADPGPNPARDLGGEGRASGVRDAVEKLRGGPALPAAIERRVCETPRPSAVGARHLLSNAGHGYDGRVADRGNPEISESRGRRPRA